MLFSRSFRSVDELVDRRVAFKLLAVARFKIVNIVCGCVCVYKYVSVCYIGFVGIFQPAI